MSGGNTTTTWGQQWAIIIGLLVLSTIGAVGVITADSSTAMDYAMGVFVAPLLTLVAWGLARVLR